MPLQPRSLRYKPSPLAQGNVDQLRATCWREFEQIARVLREGSSESLRLDVLSKLPAKPYVGLVCYFAANAVSPGSAAGVWSYDGTAWAKL